MRRHTYRFLIAVLVLSRTALAGTPSDTAVNFLTWTYQKAATQSETQRQAYVDSVLDVDRIANAIQAEANRRLRPGLVSQHDARKFVYYVTTQVTGGTGQVRILGAVTNLLGNHTSVVVQFTTISTGPRVDAKTREDLRSYYRLNPNAGKELARKRPSLPASALRSADTLIDYIENSKPSGEPAEHEYEFIVDNRTDRIVDMKVLWREGSPRKSLFLKYVDNLEAYLRENRSR